MTKWRRRRRIMFITSDLQSAVSEGKPTAECSSASGPESVDGKGGIVAG